MSRTFQHGDLAMCSLKRNRWDNAVTTEHVIIVILNRTITVIIMKPNCCYKLLIEQTFNYVRIAEY